MNVRWHTLTGPDALQKLESGEAGLTQAQAEERLRQYGSNALETGKRYSALRRFASQFRNILIYVLLGSATLTALMQHWMDTGVILTVILINALIGFIQEHKAEHALAAISKMLPVKANAVRDDEQRTVDAIMLVPGDVVMLAAGDKVPADMRLLEANDLRAQESALTGESLDVDKSVEPVEEGAPLGERSCMCYSGTLVTAGQGEGVVVATGNDTEIGRISAMLGGEKPPETPLTVKIEHFSRKLAGFILLVAAAVFLFGYYARGLPLNDMFMVMIGIAVAAIPEGLPAVISITMALGVRRMARSNAIVRHLPVIESLGSVSVICTDKTGTLTKNELTVSDIITAEGRYNVSGVGYAPDGDILREGQPVEAGRHPAVDGMAQAALLNNDAALSLRGEVWELSGDPTEGALLAFALKAGLDGDAVHETWPRIDAIPFSAEAGYMATLHQNKDDSGIVYVKGAPERVLSICDLQQMEGRSGPLKGRYWQEQVEALAKEGKRVLAVASRKVSAKQRELAPEHVGGGLTLLGLYGIMDVPREGAKSAIAACRDAGIKVKMITGDHVLTASSIGAMLGIETPDQLMTGADMEELPDDELLARMKDVHIFARMHPEHKLRLVKALQSEGYVTAMTGDGVNDAPALKRADIGIAMGIQGTEVAREASKIVLTDDNFVSITHAVEEGRNIFMNIKRTIQFMLVTDGAEALTLVTAMLAGMTLPITPLQILWVNMVTACTLSLAFAFAPHDPNVMKSMPRALDEPLLSGKKVREMLVHMVIIAFGTIALFWEEMHWGGGDIASARTAAVNTLVWFQIYYLWWLFPLRSHVPVGERYAPVVVATLSVLLFQLGFTYLPWLHTVFATAPLGMGEWVRIVIVSASILLWLVISRKFIRRK